MHRLTWHKTGQNPDQVREYLILAIIDSGATILLQDIDESYIVIANLPDCWKPTPGVTPTDATLFGAETAAALAPLKRQILDHGEGGQVEVTVGDRVFQFRMRPSFSSRGDLHLMTVITEHSHDRHREMLLQTLLREVSHRSKNLLAIIQSIATQTARHSGTLEQFLNKFRNRLFSMSRSQDLITDTSWDGARLFDLISKQTDRYLPEGRHLLLVSGDNVLLSPNATLHIGLALHELVVNSISHGGLLTGQHAPVSISSRRFAHEGAEMMELIWCEQSAPAAGAKRPALDELKRNFGSKVLERVVPVAVDGKADYRIASDAIIYRLTFPTGQRA